MGPTAPSLKHPLGKVGAKVKVERKEKGGLGGNTMLSAISEGGPSAAEGPEVVATTPSANVGAPMTPNTTSI